MQPELPLPQLRPPVSAPPPVRGVALQAGMEGVARVLSDHGGGRYTLVIGGAAVSVQSEVVLSPGQDLPFTVVREGDQLALRLTGTEASRQEAASGTEGKSGGSASASVEVGAGDRVEVGRGMALRVSAGDVSAVVLEASSSPQRDVPVVMEQGSFRLHVGGGVVTATPDGQPASPPAQAPVPVEGQAPPAPVSGEAQPAPPPAPTLPITTPEGQPASPPAQAPVPAEGHAPPAPVSGEAQPAPPPAPTLPITTPEGQPAPPPASAEGQPPAQAPVPAEGHAHPAPVSGEAQPAPPPAPTLPIATPEGQTASPPAQAPVPTEGHAPPAPVSGEAQTAPPPAPTLPIATPEGQTASPPAQAPVPTEGHAHPAPVPDAGRIAFSIQTIEQPVLLHVQARPEASPIPTTLTLPPVPSTAATLAPHPDSPVVAQVVDRPAEGTAILSVQDVRVEVSIPPHADLAIGDLVRIEPGGDALLRGLLHLLPQAEGDSVAVGDDRFDAALRQAGLTPSRATREVAAALAREHVPVQRVHVQALLAMAAGRSGDARAQTLAASARLLALDAPVSPPLAAGIAQRDMVGAPSMTDQLRSALRLLGEVRAAMPSASPLGTPVSPANPSGAVPSASAPPGTAGDGSVAPGTVPQPPLADAPSGVPASGTAVPQTETPPLTDPASVTTPLQNAMRNLEALSVLLETPETAMQLSAFTNSFGRETLAYAADQIETAVAQFLRQSPVLQKLDAALAALAGDIAAGRTQAGAVAGGALAEGAVDLASPSTLGAYPGGAGLAYPGVDADPAGSWRLPPPEAGRWFDAGRVGALLREILDAPTPDAAAGRVAEAARVLDRETLRALGQRLQDEETMRLGQESTVRSLREASGEIRDLGRRLLAMKAEALSTLRQDPPMFVADIPIRFRDEDHDSHLRMFYRKGGGRKKKQPWDQRVLLDLDLSALGTVLGDLRFAEGMLAVRILAQDADAVAHLQADAETLAAALHEKGFPCQPAFAVLPTLPVEPPPAANSTGSPTSEPSRSSSAADAREPARSRIDTRV